MLDFTTGCGAGVELKPRKPHDFAIVAVGAQSARQRQPVAQSPHIAMTWIPTATRADVIRMVARYIALEFSIRSTSGKLVIDEGRVPRKRSATIDVETATALEVFDAIRMAELRRAIYARPAARSDLRLLDGSQMPTVVPRRDVARLVKGRPTRSSASEAHDARNWRAQIGKLLGSIPKAEQHALLGAEKIRHDLVEHRNQLAAARSELGRLKGGGRHARNLRRHVEGRVAELRSRECFDSDQLKSIVRSAEYRHGVDHLLAACTRSREMERYCFGEAD